METASSDTLRHLAAELETRLDAIVAAMLRHLRAELPEWVLLHPEMWRAVEVGGRESVAIELASFRQGAFPSPAALSVDLLGARTAARQGFDLDRVLFLYRAGHRAQWEAWHELIEERELPDEQRAALLVEGSRFFFDYADRLGRLIAEAYLEERETVVTSREQRRMHAVAGILNGDVTWDARALDYALDRHHLGAVAWGGSAQAALRALASRLDRRLLSVSFAEDVWWAWLGGSEPVSTRLRDVLACWRPPPGAWLALGREGWGPDGFRRTHADASVAHRVGRADGRAVTGFDDVALEALAAADEERARRFVAEELRGLEDDGERSRRLRETLRAWFAAGQNASATAAALGVHEQTVAQRLRSVEERTGRPVTQRRAELETALRLRRYLGR